MTFDIRPSRADDAPRLPAVERSAGEQFRTLADLAWIADGGDMSVDRHLQLIDRGSSWVAESRDRRILGFLCAEAMGDVLHIWELAVVLDHQRRGIGRALVNEAIAFGRRRSLSSVTLTTFRSVPWNEPAYLRMGFETIAASDYDQRIAAIFEREAESGLPLERRCAMRLKLQAAA